MKQSIKLLCCLIILLFSCVTLAYELDDGYYMMSAPSVYSAKQDGKPVIWSTYVKQVKDYHSLRFIRGPKGHPMSGYLSFSINKNNKIKIIKGRSVMNTISWSITGYGELIDNNIINGKLTVQEHIFGRFSFTNNTGEWYLRPATLLEIKNILLEGFKSEARRRISRNQITSIEVQTLYNLNTEAKRKFLQLLSNSRKFELLKEMINNKEIIYTKGVGFHLKGHPKEEIPPPPISSDVKVEEEKFSDETIKKLKKLSKKRAQEQKELLEQTLKAKAKTKPGLNQTNKPQNINAETEDNIFCYMLTVLIVLLISIVFFVFKFTKRD